MKDYNGEIEYKNKKYKLVFNVNVVEKIQEESGSYDNWVNLVQPEEKGKETDLKAFKFAFAEAINEGIDIENEDNGTNIEPLTLKQIGRMLNEIGIKEANKELQKTIIESTKGEEKNV